ncbi:MAG TPA: glycosyltransferase family 39 protein [Stellaceae bacterium]|nr:glycosyltransferase family 39 protein [Stellaceae bacterium]
MAIASPALARRFDSRFAVALGLLILLLAVELALFWVGYQGSDDQAYAEGGFGWLEHFPYVGDSHWTLRHTIVLPIALSFRLLGISEFALALVNVVYLVAFLAVNFFCLRRYFGDAMALTASFIAATVPMFVVGATYVNTDVAELFFIALAAWLFLGAGDDPAHAGPRLIVAGIAAGLGFLTRETTLALLVAWGVTFLFRPLLPRRLYWLMAVGFLAIVALDMAYLWHFAGDPLYRFHIDAHHDHVDRAADVARVHASGALFDLEGNLSVSVWLDPILVLLVTQKYALLFWAAVPAMAATLRKNNLGCDQARVLRFLALLFVVWVLFIGLNAEILYISPRYYLVTAWIASVFVGYWLVALWDDRRRLVGAAIVLALLGGDFACLSVENIDPRYGERQLARLAASHNETIYADPQTARRAGLLLRIDGAAGRVKDASPQPGALYLYNPDAFAACRASFRCNDDMTGYAPRADWIALEHDAPRPRLMGRIVAATGLASLLPAPVLKKLLVGAPGVTLYRVPPG